MKTRETGPSRYGISKGKGDIGKRCTNYNCQGEKKRGLAGRKIKAIQRNQSDSGGGGTTR